MYKKILLLCALTTNVYAANTTPANQNTTTPPATTEEQQKQLRTIEINEQMLLQNTELLTRVMYSVLRSDNIEGIKVILPIYQKWPQHDKTTAALASGLLAQSEGRAREAARHYQQVLAEFPEAATVRWRLAIALFNDKQNKAAADQFDRLSKENLPEEVLNTLKQYRQALRNRDSWKFNWGGSPSIEKNINQAPDERRLETDTSDSCKQIGGCGFTFETPINALAINYRLSGEKQWSLPRGGWYITGSAGINGKFYPSFEPFYKTLHRLINQDGDKDIELSKYSDVTLEIAHKIGHAGRNYDISLEPYHERRFYGKKPYTYTNGVRLSWEKQLTAQTELNTNLDLGKLKNLRNPNADNSNYYLGTSVTYFRNPQQYWQLGTDIYREYYEKDKSDSFNNYTLRGAWGQEWNSGFSTRLSLRASARKQDGPSFFSNGERREDMGLGASLSLSHKVIRFKGVTPRLTIAHNINWSNDIMHDRSSTKVFINLGRSF